MRFIPELKRVYVGFPFSEFKQIKDAFEWIAQQDGYKNKTVNYDVCCHSSVEVDQAHNIFK